LNTAELVQCVDHELGKMRTSNQDFPIIVLRANEKDEFIQKSEDSDTVKQILVSVSNDVDIKNVCLRIWSGYLDASKMHRDKYVVERNHDGSPKREEPITTEMRKNAFAQIATKVHDHIYEVGVKETVFWQLKVMAIRVRKSV